MKNVSTAKLEVYKDEQIMLIAPKEMLQNFLIYIACMAIDASDNCKNKNLNATAEAYKDFRKQIKKQIDVQN